MSALWESVVKGIKDGVTVAAEKTGELTKMGKIKVDILTIKHNIEKAFTEVGGRAYHMIVEEGNTDVASDSEIQGVIERIKGLEQDLNAKKDEYDNVRSDKGEEEPEEAVTEEPELEKVE